MAKTAAYHRSAVQYNAEAAEFFENQSTRLEDEEVSRWAAGISRQHVFHRDRHQNALDRLESETPKPKKKRKRRNNRRRKNGRQHAAPGPVYDDISPVGSDLDQIESDIEVIEQNLDKIEEQQVVESGDGIIVTNTQPEVVVETAEEKRARIFSQFENKGNEEQA